MCIALSKQVRSICAGLVDLEFDPNASHSAAKSQVTCTQLCTATDLCGVWLQGMFPASIDSWVPPWRFLCSFLTSQEAIIPVWHNSRDRDNRPGGWERSNPTYVFAGRLLFLLFWAGGCKHKAKCLGLALVEARSHVKLFWMRSKTGGSSTERGRRLK